MAYVQTKSGLSQTAYNAAASLAVALIATETFDEPDDAVAFVHETAKEFYAELEKVADADNKAIKAANSDEDEPRAAKKSGSKSKPAAKSSGKGSSSKKSSSITVEDARETELNFGKFQGVTLGEVWGMSKSDAEEYGYDKPGRKYVTWLAESNADQNAFIARRAQLIIDAAQSASDEDDDLDDED